MIHQNLVIPKSNTPLGYISGQACLFTHVEFIYIIWIQVLDLHSVPQIDLFIGIV